MSPDKVYKEDGNPYSDQAEHSSANPGAARTDMRTLIELQVISLLLHKLVNEQDDLRSIRKDVAASIT